VTVWYGSAFDQSFTGTIDARNLATPTGNDVFGLTFTNVVGTTGGVLTTTNYIDYLYASTFVGTNPGSAASFIAGTVLSSGSSVPFQVTFKYDTSSWLYITDDQLATITSSINANMLSIQGNVRAARAIAISAAGNYTSYYTAAAAASSGASNAATQVTALNAAIATRNANIVTLQASYVSYQTQMDAQTAAISTAANTETTNQKAAQDANGQYTSKNATCTQLQADSTTNTNNAASYLTAYTTAYNSLNSTVYTYAEETGEFATAFKASVTTLAVAQDYTTFVTTITNCLS